MTCPACGTEVPGWALQCPACGADVAPARTPSGANGAPGWSAGDGTRQAGRSERPGWGQPSPWPELDGPPSWGPPGYGAGTGAWSPPPAEVGRLAGWWFRVGATLVDGIILGIVTVALELALRRPGVLVAFLVGCAYNGWFLSTRGQTPGMMAVGTRVADAGTGDGISFWRGVARYAIEQLLFVVFFLPGILDVLWPLWDRRNQTLHDKAVATVVLHAR